MTGKLSFYEHSPLQSPVSIISIPTDLGSDARGLAKNPAYLKTHGLLEMLSSLGAEVADEMEIPCPAASARNFGRLKNLSKVAEVSDEAAKTVETLSKRGDIVLALGGDHSLSIGTLRGASAAHASLGVIWIDAHPDVHTHETTTTHNLHGMPAALAMGFGHPQLLGEQRQPIKPEHFLFIGLKDFAEGDRGEIDFLRRESPPLYTMLDIAERGLSPVFTSIAALSRKVKKIYVIMDMDSIDQSFAPGVAMPNTNGLTRREALALAQYIGKACDVAGIDIAEMLPANDTEGKTAGLALEIIARLLGGEYSWYRNYMNEYEEIAKKRASSFL